MNSQFEYKDAMNALHYTDAQKALLAERAAQTARKAQKRSRRPLLRTALIAACLTAALAVTAGATGVLKSAAGGFAPIFGGSAAQTEIIDKIGYPVGASDTDNGVTITGRRPSWAMPTTPPSSSPSPGTTARPCCLPGRRTPCCWSGAAARI